MKTIAEWKLPIKTVSEGNCSQHWTKKAKRRKIQRGWIKAAMRTQPLQSLFTAEHPNENSHSAPRRICVVLTRIAPRSLDCHDNLPMALKGVVDAIAEELTQNYVPGRADDAKWISWEYRQEKGKSREYAVRIEIRENDESVNEHSAKRDHELGNEMAQT